MVNSRDSLSKIPSTNHDGMPYILDLDIYKEGYWAYDISNYYKGRVDDNGTPFQVRWFEHGQIKNVQGLRPFIRGTVGQHTVDDETDPDNPKVVPSPDCSQIDQTGETTDTMPGGIAVYRMVNQCFTQEGMFYGEIGLKDSSGLVLSSVDIAFKVLGGRMNMVGARKFYVSEFEKALDNLNAIIDKTKKDFAKQLQDLIDDSRNTYLNATREAHDSLDALKAQIQANRDEQNTLAQHLIGTENQIKIHDIVTRPEFQGNIDQINKNTTDAISKVTSGAPKPIENLATLQANYPNGDSGFYVTSDTGHKCAFLNGAWQDFGVYQATAMPEVDKNNLDRLVNSHTTRNLIVNNDFLEGMDHWYSYQPLTSYIDSSSGSNLVTLNSHQLTTDGWGSFMSEHISVTPGQRISAAVSYKWSPDDASVDGAALCINFYDNPNGDGERLDYATIGFGETSDFTICKLENVLVPDKAVSARLMVQSKRNGTIIFYRPILVKDAIVEGYVPESIDTLYKNKFNLLVDPIFAHRDAYWHTDPTAKVTFGDYYQGLRALTFETHGNSTEQWKAFYSNTFSVTPGEKLKWNTLLKWIPDDASTDKLVITLNFFSSFDASHRVSYKLYTLTNPVTDWKKFEESQIITPDNASTANVMFQVLKNGSVSICDPNVSQSVETNFKNLVKDSEFNDQTRWYNDSNVVIKSDHSFNGHNSRTIVNHNSKTPVYYSDESQKIKVKGGSSIDAYITASFTPDTDSNDTAVFIINEYEGFDNASGRINFKTVVIESTGGEFAKFGIRNYTLGKNTNYVSFMMQLVQNGNLEYTQPIIQYHKNTKAICDNDTFDMSLSNNLMVSYLPKWYRGQNGYQIYSNDNQNHAFCISDKIKVDNAKSVSAFANMSWSPINTNAVALMVINYWNKDNQRISFEQVKNSRNNTIQTVKLDSCLIPKDATTISLQFELIGTGRLYFTLPRLVLDNRVVPNVSEKITQIDSKTDLPVVNLFGDISGMSKDKYKLLRFEYQNGIQHINGYADTKWQGDSSLNFDKKNFRIKLYQDDKKENKLKIKPQATWQPESKFNLKANFADATMARNIVNSRIAGEVSATRAGLPNEIVTAPNFATVDGFPIHLYINNTDAGIYTFNLTKEIFGNAKNGVASTSYCNATLFNADSAKFDGSDYEALTDTLTDDGKTSFNNLLKFVHMATDEDFVKNIDKYISVSSVIDYLIVNNIIGALDCWGKNTEYVTYDNKKWYCLFYDMDISYGSNWNGSAIDTNSILNSILYSSSEGDNLLYKRINNLFIKRIKERYTELRSWLTPNYIILKYKRFMDHIGESNYKLDQSLWNTTSKDLYTFKQLQEYVYKRFQILDSFWLQDNQDQITAIKARLTNLEHGTTQK